MGHPTPPGTLLEYTFEAETRPMVSLEPDDLDKLQDVAASVIGVYDPVFGLDESTGSISTVFQVEAPGPAVAASLGAWYFTNMLVLSGITSRLDVLETLCATLSEADSDGELDYTQLLTGG